MINKLTFKRPSRRMLRMRWFFDVSKGKESSFLIGPHWPPPFRFFMRILWKIPINALSALILQLSQMVLYFIRKYEIEEKKDVYSH